MLARRRPVACVISSQSSRVVGLVDEIPYPMHPRLMGQQVAQRDGALAVRGELGPPGRDRLVVGQQTPVDQAVHDGGDHPLGGREGHRHGVALPRTAAAGGARPDVDDGLAVMEHRDGSTATGAAARHDGVELVRDGGEVRMDEPSTDPASVHVDQQTDQVECAEQTDETAVLGDEHAVDPLVAHLLGRDGDVIARGDGHRHTGHDVCHGARRHALRCRRTLCRELGEDRRRDRLRAQQERWQIAADMGLVGDDGDDVGLWTPTPTS